MALCPIEMKRCGCGRGGPVEAIRFHCRPRAQRRKKLTAARLRVSQNKPGCAALRDAESDSGVHGNEIVDFSLIGLVVRECIQISLGDWRLQRRLAREERCLRGLRKDGLRGSAAAGRARGVLRAGAAAPAGSGGAGCSSEPRFPNPEAFFGSGFGCSAAFAAATAAAADLLAVSVAAAVAFLAELSKVSSSFSSSLKCSTFFSASSARASLRASAPL